jgi:SNF2 family DNA or RNA helicase
MLKTRSDINLAARHHGYAFQVEAVDAVKDLPYAAMFHEQGLGKTKIGVDIALEWLKNKVVDSVLIVTKRALISNWADELKSHTFLTPRILSQDRSSNFFSLNSPVRLYLAHYEALKSEERRIALFLKTRRVGVILDEAHKIKNPDSGVAKTLHRLSGAFARRVVMTGTPVANRPYDIWSQIFFLDAGEALGKDFERFREELDLTNDLWADDARRAALETGLAGIFAKIRGFAIRETKTSAGIELPEKQIQNLYVEPEPTQRALYDQYRNDLRATITRDGVRVDDDAEEMLKRLLRLVQIASNPALVDQSYSATPGKLPRLIELVEDAVAAGSKMIIWTNFVENARWLRQVLATYGTAAVHGGLSNAEREDAVRLFKTDANCRLLIATPGSAKEGLTLTVANRAVFYDRSFSLDDYLQAQDRIHRISQQQTCFVWNLICSGTVDEWLDSLLAAKRLAAQLAQADISLEEYRARANYEFGRIVREILGMEKDGQHDNS